MKKGIYTVLYTIIYAFILSTCWAQEEDKEDRTRFSDMPNCYRRLSTSEKDKKSGLLLPKYDDVASDRDKGITIEDWEKVYLSPKSFQLLDENGDDLITREELEKDKFMGDVQIHYQTKDLIKKYCKTDFPDYNERAKLLKQKGYQDVEKTASYVVNKKISFDKEEIPTAMLSEYPGSSEVATKTYIQLKHGFAMNKKVDVGTYALLLMQDQKQEDSLSMHILTAVILLLSGIITFLFSKS